MRSLLKIISIVIVFFQCIACTESTDGLTDANSSKNGILGFFDSSEENELIFEKITDPKENAFSVDVPKGWSNKISLERFNTVTRQCGVVISPDNKTRVFFGDPSIPNFILPQPQIGLYENGQFDSPMSQVKSYVNGEQFLSDYTKMAFGKNPAFRIISVQPNDVLKSEYSDAFKKFTNDAKVSAYNVRFEFSQNQEKVIGEIQGVSFLIGPNWNVEVKGFTSHEGGFQIAQNILDVMSKSFKTNPEWREKENKAFAMRMENDRNNNAMIMNQMQSNHNQRMNDMNSNFNAHQQRMGNLQQSYDSYNQGYQQNQTYQDDQHRRFIDNVRGQEQVSSGNSQTKVEAGYNHYYVNQSNGTYIGTNNELQTTPNDYQEWQIDN